VNKKIYVGIAIIIILLYAAIVLSQTSAFGLGAFFGDVFGYIFYVVIIAGIVAAVWLAIKRPQKAS
jgi:hypothetical protein